jgi:hypothetical protein
VRFSRYRRLSPPRQERPQRVVTTDAYCRARAAIAMPDAVRVAEELERRAIAQPHQLIPLRDGICTMVSRRFGSCAAHRLVCLYDEDTVILLWIGPIADSLMPGRTGERRRDV